jgi:hypothetical protein
MKIGIKMMMMMIFNLFKNFFIFMKNKTTDVKFLLTMLLTSLIVLELAKFFNINLDYFYYFALTPAIWLIYIAYDKYIVPIIAWIIIKLFNLNKFHDFIPSIISIFTRLFVLYHGGMSYYICTYFLYFIETYNISLIPVFNNINKNIFETIYKSKIFNSIYETIYNLNIFNSINNSVNNNIINIYININNNITEIIHNLNLFNENIINIFKNINNNIIETMYKINIYDIFNNTNSLNLTINKNTIINIINELFKNKLYLNGFNDYVNYNDFNVKIALYNTGTPENVETSKSNSGNGSRSISINSNQGSQPVAGIISNQESQPVAENQESQSVTDIISNNPRHSRSAPPYTNENLIRWGINDLEFAKAKFGDIISPLKDPNTNAPIEILRGYKNNITPHSVLVYLDKNSNMSRIEIDESKVISLYIEETKKYYDPVHGIWWDESTGRWIDSDLYYLRGDIRINTNFDTRIKAGKNYSTVFINRTINKLPYDEKMTTYLKNMAEWNLAHFNTLEYIRPNNSPLFTSIEAGRSHMLSLTESKVKFYANKLWCVDRPISYFDKSVKELLWIQSQLRTSKAEKKSISILIDQILALKCQTLYLNNNLSNYFRLLEKDYKWLQSTNVYIEENEKHLNLMFKKPSSEIKEFNNVNPNNRDTS